MNLYQYNPSLIASQSSRNLQRKNLGSSPLAPSTNHNKENISNHRNKNQEKYMKHEYYQTELSKNRPIFQHQENQPYSYNVKKSLSSQKGVEFRPLSADARTFQAKNMLNPIQQRSQLQRKAEIKTRLSRNKSVRFSEQSVELTQTVTLKSRKQRQLIFPTRSRSTSILKNKVKSAKILQLKAQSLLKSRQQESPNIFSIGEYKNTLVRQRYNHLLRNYSKKKDLEVRSNSLHCRPEDRLVLRVDKKNVCTDFIDTNFPLNDSSIFKTKRPELTNIKWARISELFANKQLLVVREGQSNVVSLREQTSFAERGFATALNLIRSNRSLLYRIFQNSSYNEAGLYMLKIFFKEQWKCVIINDFIPVYCDQFKGISYPAFTNLTQIQNLKSDQLEIWPLLLEKAYASVLGSYERVHQGSLMQYLGHMMGLPVQKLTLDWQKSSKWIGLIKGSQEQAIIFGFSKSEKYYIKGQRLPLRITNVLSNDDEQGSNSCFYCEQLGTKMTIKMSLNYFKRSFDELYVIRVSTMQHLTSTNITVSPRFNIMGGRNLSCRDFHIVSKGNFKIKRQRAIIRSFTVQNNEQMSLILKLKTESKGNHRQWLRAFLFMKELDSYRWVQGKYSHSIVSFSSLLEPGQYFIVILPDWTDQRHSQLILHLYSRVKPISLIHHNQHSPQTIIEKGCTDYAQRFGKMIQVNRWICTYALVDTECGLIIENINNERRNGKVKIHRSIANLNPSNTCLLPLNAEFYEKQRIKQEIQLFIDKENSYSVTLLLFGGNDKAFLNTFNFGN